MNYTPPTPEEIAAAKETLARVSAEMAADPEDDYLGVCVATHGWADPECANPVFRGEPGSEKMWCVHCNGIAEQNRKGNR